MYLYTNVLKDVGVTGVFHFWASLEMCFVGQINGKFPLSPPVHFLVDFKYNK